MSDTLIVEGVSVPKTPFCHIVVRYALINFAFTSRDHETRSCWIGPSYPLDLSTLPIRSDKIPLQYPSLSLFIVFND